MRWSLRVSGAMAGGALMAAAFPPLSQPLLLLVGVAMLVGSIRRGSQLTAAVLGFIAGCTGLAIAVSWLWPTVSAFTGGSTATAIVFGLVFLAYHASQFAIFGLAAAVWPRRDGLAWTCAGVASLWVVVEWGFPHVAPWSLGDGLAASPVLRQASDLAGVHGLSFLVAFAATALALAGEERGRGSRVRALGVGLVVLVAMAAYGQARLGADWSTGATLRVTALQGGLGTDVDPRQPNERAWAIYEPMTLASAGDGDDGRIALIVWPETTLRSLLRYDGRDLLRLRRLADRAGSALLVGAQDLPPSGRGSLNSAFLILPRERGGRVSVAVYHKRALLPFGEYVPAADWLELVVRWRTTGGYVPGEYGGPLELGDGIKLGPSICFEAMQPGGANRMVWDGATILVNLSDDGRFAGAAARRQHLGGALMRAIETRRWLVRVSDSGISAVIDPAGRIVDRLDSGAVGALRARVPLQHVFSLYVYFGDWIVPVCVLLIVGRMCSAAFARLPRRRAGRLAAFRLRRRARRRNG